MFFFLFLLIICCYSVAKSGSILWPHGLQHARLTCPSPYPRDCSNSCPLSWWCHPTISSPVTPFSSCPQSFPASGSFPVSWLFTSDGQSIGASASVLPMNIQDWFPLGFTGWIFLLSKGLLKVFSSTTIRKHQFFSIFIMVQLSHPYMTVGKTIALTIQTFVVKVMSLLFNMLSRFVMNRLLSECAWYKVQKVLLGRMMRLCLFFCFGSCLEACGILVPQP